MRRLLAGLFLMVLGLAGCSGSGSVEDTPEARRGLAEDLTRMAREAGEYDRMLDEGAATAREATADALVLEIGRELTEAELDSAQSALRGVLAEFVTEQKWAECVSDATEKHFTAGELAAIGEFYASPVGKRLVEREAALTADVEAAIEAILEERLDEFIGRADAALAEALPDLAEALQ